MKPLRNVRSDRNGDYGPVECASAGLLKALDVHRCPGRDDLVDYDFPESTADIGARADDLLAFWARHRDALGLRAGCALVRDHLQPADPGSAGVALRSLRSLGSLWPALARGELARPGGGRPQGAGSVIPR